MITLIAAACRREQLAGRQSVDKRRVATALGCPARSHDDRSLTPRIGG
jgi:hypothetical protein